ncbi:uncharacterized protein UTRI_05059 [Ustilago trichophora]|uniref:Velvet domain-containing protein n=1 Tax=Ustilago trichophora TaxID=86804 RepID=A0A5C3EE48_9BASI|nr:uncharacterized protein UTRI_05059 [Ustilago trichophora]
MSIPNKDAPADQQHRSKSADQQLQQCIDNTSRHDAHDIYPERHRMHPENSHHDNNSFSMRPPPLPSSSRVPMAPQSASRGDASQSVASTQLPGMRSFPTEAYGTGRTYGGERKEQHRDQHPDRLSSPTIASYPHRTQQSHRESYRDTAPYGNDEHSSASESRPPRISHGAPSPVNNGGVRLHELRTGPTAPPPMLTCLPHHSNDHRTYKLIIRQQPKQGRLCGLGSKDKRPLDPLPILQLRILKEDGTEDEDAENSSNLILQVSLRKEDPNARTHSDAVLVESNDPSYPWTRMLEGRLVASANVARDLDGSRACFFVFTDLSIRQEGQFRLAFKLIAIGPPSLPTMGASSTNAGGQVLAEALTEPFAIYSPRRFPGMTESTELAKCLARQGIQVPVRNDVRGKKEQPDSYTASTDDKDNLD